MRKALLFFCGLLAVVSGCTRDNLLHGMYDGFRVHNELQSSPPERAVRQESPAYSDYQRMRKETTEDIR